MKVFSGGCGLRRTLAASAVLVACLDGVAAKKMFLLNKLPFFGGGSSSSSSAPVAAVPRAPVSASSSGTSSGSASAAVATRRGHPASSTARTPDWYPDWYLLWTKEQMDLAKEYAVFYTDFKNMIIHDSGLSKNAAPSPDWSFLQEDAEDKKLFEALKIVAKSAHAEVVKLHDIFFGGKIGAAVEDAEFEDALNAYVETSRSEEQASVVRKQYRKQLELADKCMSKLFFRHEAFLDKPTPKVDRLFGGVEMLKFSSERKNKLHRRFWSETVAVGFHKIRKQGEQRRELLRRLLGDNDGKRSSDAVEKRKNLYQELMWQLTSVASELRTDLEKNIFSEEDQDATDDDEGEQDASDEDEQMSHDSAEDSDDSGTTDEELQAVGDEDDAFPLRWGTLLLPPGANGTANRGNVALGSELPQEFLAPVARNDDSRQEASAADEFLSADEGDGPGAATQTAAAKSNKERKKEKRKQLKRQKKQHQQQVGQKSNFPSKATSHQPQNLSKVNPKIGKTKQPSKAQQKAAKQAARRQARNQKGNRRK
ncbi:unnamed protein product [Amoebophrya sp. A25]|nr:unnamed protein product [Amoebophrya sp. A25]|eukprot:GSA25T00010142001.1